MIVPKFPPNVIAAVDQWLADANNQLATPVAHMREIMACADTETRIAAIALFVGDRAVGDRNQCRELACAYMLALRELAILQQKTEHR